MEGSWTTKYLLGLWLLLWWTTTELSLTKFKLANLGDCKTWTLCNDMKDWVTRGPAPIWQSEKTSDVRSLQLIKMQDRETRPLFSSNKACRMRPSKTMSQCDYFLSDPPKLLSHDRFLNGTCLMIELWNASLNSECQVNREYKVNKMYCNLLFLDSKNKQICLEMPINNLKYKCPTNHVQCQFRYYFLQINGFADELAQLKMQPKCRWSNFLSHPRQNFAPPAGKAHLCSSS